MRPRTLADLHGTTAMAMVTDPVCGMRIDPEDAAAAAVHDGERQWFWNPTTTSK